MIKFGPAGISTDMRKAGVRKSVDAPQLLMNMGLNAFEYQCGRGVNISLPVATEFGNACKTCSVTPSVHSPYYISLSSIEEDKRLKSISYILQTAEVAKSMGGNRIVVHSGSCAKLTREEALELAKDTLSLAAETLKEKGLEGIHICPETMGKINQLGTLEEVLQLCLVNDNFIPCIDFGHLNARSLGGIKTEKDFKDILDKIENTLGYDKLKYMHCHFAKVEYSQGGEKHHLTFDDREFGPDFEPLANQLFKRGLEPTIICESADRMDRDAVRMMEIYDNIKNKKRKNKK